MHERGLSLLEVLIAVAILSVAALGVAQWLGMAFTSIATARAQTMTVTLASARIEQLRSLAFEFDDDGQRITDLNANLSTKSVRRDGGGLSGAGADSLVVNTRGFIDYLDGQGRWVGNGLAAPPDAVFVRRWSIEPSGGSADRVVLQVLVRPVAADAPGDASVRRTPAESRFTTVLVRTHR